MVSADRCGSLVHCSLKELCNKLIEPYNISSSPSAKQNQECRHFKKPLIKHQPLLHFIKSAQKR